MKWVVSMVVAGLFFLMGVRLITNTGATMAKALLDTSLPANYSIFASFAHFATPQDWIYIVLSVMMIVIGIVFAIAIQRTKWLPE